MAGIIEMLARLMPKPARHRPYPEAAYEFTDLYGRVEDALRKLGICKKNRDNAEADWEAFAREKLGEDFFKEVKKSGKASTLIAGRPRKQMKEGLAWQPEEPKAIANVTELIVNGVCQVRNHINHHQKFQGDDAARKRDLALIEDSRRVLEMAIAKYPDLKKHL